MVGKLKLKWFQAQLKHYRSRSLFLYVSSQETIELRVTHSLRDELQILHPAALNALPIEIR